MIDLEEFWYYGKREETPEEIKCNHDWIIADGFYVCQNCGECNAHKIIFVEKQLIHRRHVYKRRAYFRDKIRLFTRSQQSTSDDYIKMIETLKNYQFETIHELKRIIKKLKYGIHHKYLDRSDFDVKQHNLVDLKHSDIEQLEYQFHEFERLFKQLYPKQKYIINESIIIHYLLKRNGYQCYKNILLPRNHNKSTKKFIEVLNKY